MIFGVGLGLFLLGLVMVLAVSTAEGIIASGILGLLAVIAFIPALLLLYVSYRIKAGGPATEVAFRQRLPSFLTRLFN